MPDRAGGRPQATPTPAECGALSFELIDDLRQEQAHEQLKQRRFSMTSAVRQRYGQGQQKSLGDIAQWQ